MSLQNAKRIADLAEEANGLATKVSAKRKGFRVQVDEEVVEAFTQYLQSNGFTVVKNQERVKADYKGLSVELVLETSKDGYIGVFHSFDIKVGGKAHAVRVIPKFVGEEPDVVHVNKDEVTKLEGDIARYSKLLANLELDSYEFALANGKTWANPIRKSTIPELLDHLLA